MMRNLWGQTSTVVTPDMLQLGWQPETKHFKYVCIYVYSFKCVCIES